MVDVVVEPLDPHLAGEAEFAGFYAVRSASLAVDTPEEDPVTYENVVGRLRTPCTSRPARSRA